MTSTSGASWVRGQASLLWCKPEHRAAWAAPFPKAHPEPGRRACLHAGVVMCVADHAAGPILNVWEKVYRVESYAPWHMASHSTISRLQSKFKDEWVMGALCTVMLQCMPYWLHACHAGMQVA